MFITLEGPEGAGKSTLSRGLAAELRRGGREVLSTREPGAGVLGGKIRALLLEGDEVDPRAELMLFLADRAQHVASLIRPALAQGITVICDRHIDSTVVYQGYARGFLLDDLRAWNAFVTGGLHPDRTLLLDLPAELGLARLTDTNRLDREPLEFHQKVREGFLAEAALHPNRFSILDATLSPNDLLAHALAAIG